MVSLELQDLLEYDGELVRKNRELSEFVHELLTGIEEHDDWGRWYTNNLLRGRLVKALLARGVPYSHPIYGALEPKGRVHWGDVANAPKK